MNNPESKLRQEAESTMAAPPPPPEPVRRAALEVPVFSSHDALNAPGFGAKRIELNDAGSYDQGGLTPSMEMFHRVAGTVKVSLRIMIRPRGPPAEGPDFIYTDAEFCEMEEAIVRFKESGLLRLCQHDGFVFGILMYDRDRKLVVDVRRCDILRRLAGPYECIFHRAFDTIAASNDESDLIRGLHDIDRARMTGILTSGGPGSYMNNLDRIRRIIEISPPLLVITIGGGVRSDNIEAALEHLALRDSRTWFHSSCITGGDHAVDTEELDLLRSILGLDPID